MEDEKQRIKEAAESSLLTFIKLVHPGRVLGGIHEEVISWMTREDAKSHQLLLLPRDHQKSALMAYRAAWEITRNPAIRILYISSTAMLAVKQLKFIKDILTCDVYQYFWPEMVNPDLNSREKWTETEISIDHPLRKQEFIRDPTIFTAGLTTNIVGLHCDIAIMDDIVVDENAATALGRERVENQAGYLASIAGTEGRVYACGTRYHPKDYYGKMLDMVVELRNDDGEVTESFSLYEVFERAVENRGDGTGEFIWPRKQRADGKWFGFDKKVLAIKKAQYKNLANFRAQYYNQPNDLSTSTIVPDYFQYYNKERLTNSGGLWYLNGQRLNLFAAIDFAYSIRKGSDWSAIVVVGVDSSHNYYVLDVDRFQTNKISDYFQRILRMYNKWGFRKLRAETTAAQSMIVEDLKDNYVRQMGLALSIEGKNPSRTEGSKEERIEAVLQPKYANKQIWHYKGGNCDLLEEELVMTRPPHDDIKDCLAAAIECAIAPAPQRNHNSGQPRYSTNRFGWSAA